MPRNRTRGYNSLIFFTRTSGVLLAYFVIYPATDSNMAALGNMDSLHMVDSKGSLGTCEELVAGIRVRVNDTLAGYL